MDNSADLAVFRMTCLYISQGWIKYPSMGVKSPLQLTGELRRGRESKSLKCNYSTSLFFFLPKPPNITHFNTTLEEVAPAKSFPNVSSHLIHLTCCPPDHHSGRVSVFISSQQFSCFFLQRWTVCDLPSCCVFFFHCHKQTILILQPTEFNVLVGQKTAKKRKKKSLSSSLVYYSIHQDTSAFACPSPTVLRHFPSTFKAVGSALFQPPAPPDLITPLQYM